MTAVLSRLLGRLPIGWLQLSHNPMRLFAALAGVAFANILIFVQLGFLGGLSESTMFPYRIMNADILLIPPETNTLGDTRTIPRQRLFQALAVEGVKTATPFYVGTLSWEREDGKTSNLRTFGIDPNSGMLKLSGKASRLKLPDTALIDSKTRNLPSELKMRLNSGSPYVFETADRRLTIQGAIEVGAGFDADGYLVMSDQTFLSFFPNRKSGAPSYVMVQVRDGYSQTAIASSLQAVLPSSDTIVRTLDGAAKHEQSYQLVERPVGIIFGFGVVIGVLVGITIVYQVLSTDVADHLAEYATMKAIGYGQRFFLGIVFEEALVLAVLGFIPGIVVSLGLYVAISSATGLPIEMDFWRPIYVLFGTIAMCCVSGAIATRRLANADPADLF